MKRYWNEYQKEIADDKFFYERSCIRQTFFPGSEAAFLKMLREELGKDIYDEANQHTCTGIGYHSDIVPLQTTMTVVARLFALMTEAGYENYVPSCVTSFGVFTEMVEMWKHNPELLEKTRKILYDTTGRTFEIPKNIAHPSDIIYKFRYELKQKMKYQLVNRFTGKPLRVVEHIGCHYAKIFPKAGVGNAEFPYVLAGMIEAWGGEVIDYPERRHCCGFGFFNFFLQLNKICNVPFTVFIFILRRFIKSTNNSKCLCTALYKLFAGVKKSFWVIHFTGRNAVSSCKKFYTSRFTGYLITDNINTINSFNGVYCVYVYVKYVFTDCSVKYYPYFIVS